MPKYQVMKLLKAIFTLKQRVQFFNYYIKAITRLIYDAAVV